MAAIPLSFEVDGFDTIEIPGGKFARFRHVGNMPFIAKTISDIYKRIIPEFFPDINRARTVLHYEFYNYQFRWNQSDSIIYIYLPIVENTKSAL